MKVQKKTCITMVSVGIVSSNETLYQLIIFIIL